MYLIVLVGMLVIYSLYVGVHNMEFFIENFPNYVVIGAFISIPVILFVYSVAWFLKKRYNKDEEA